MLINFQIKNWKGKLIQLFEILLYFNCDGRNLYLSLLFLKDKNMFFQWRFTLSEISAFCQVSIVQTKNPLTTTTPTAKNLDAKMIIKNKKTKTKTKTR